MADNNTNSGQFGERKDTEKQARKGGEASGGNPQNLNHKARVEGGKHSHKNQNS